jgi:signal peptidase I
MITILVRWFLSRTVREATLLYRVVRRLIREQEDLLPPSTVQSVSAEVQAVRQGIIEGEGAEELRRRMAALEQTAQQSLIPHPHPGWRENVIEFSGTALKILAIFCFFIQPMAIPSGSAQPTLFGITHRNLKGDDTYVMPSLGRRFFDSVARGVHHYHLVAKEEGKLQMVEAPRTFIPLIKRQRFLIGGRWHTVWLPTDNLAERAGLSGGEVFRKGEDVLKLRVVSGDHLFVNRMVYNFRRPFRGETIVFTSTGIPHLIQNTHYIKRLVALGGDTVRIGNDRHLVVNGERLEANVPGFERVYGFRGPPKESVYSGHVNEFVGRECGRPGLAPLFRTEDQEFQVRPNHYLVMGDNTMNSFDSRAWGDFPREKVVGRSSFVFWPISPRFGWGYR